MKKLDDSHSSAFQQGLVISYHGNSVAVEADDGQVFPCHLHRNQELPVVGDRVQWQLGNDRTGTIAAIMPRRSLLARGDHRGRMKPIAANVDALGIVMAPAPIFSEYLIDRYLVAAEILRIKPLIILNKIDLLNETTRADADKRLQPYRRIPYEVILSSIYSENGLQDLADYLPGKTAALVGPSGVGKSSIISALSATAAIRVGDVSTQGGGKHTTTATRLYHLTQGGSLIDSPGVREFNLWAVTKQELLQSFIEFQSDYACKFRDCQHLQEPGCAIQAALQNGEISHERYASYQTLMRTMNEKNTTRR